MIARSAWEVARSMFRFEKLEVWKEAMQYANKVYDFTETLPKSEIFGLSSQLKRASLSIPSNIAEGSGSSTLRDFAHSLDIAIKSAIETVSELFFAKMRGYIKEEKQRELYDEAEILIKRIQGLKQYLRKDPRAKTNVPRA